ncbi:hypothetical protein [Nocardioides sp. JS614]|uniref:hypothetical protein n=1 Tax=Nocardioides sp. (strain ATCC BAA-499 / JS614) TaxID=196162 RepID=UPI002367597A|nr:MULTISPECIES: hypothetical protein [unclassified Nocardioides]
MKEARLGETRVAATPASVAQLCQLGYDVVEPGAGARSEVPDAAYVGAGAIVGDPLVAEIVLGVNPPSTEQLDRLAQGATLISLLASARRGAGR